MLLGGVKDNDAFGFVTVRGWSEHNSTCGNFPDRQSICFVVGCDAILLRLVGSAQSSPTCARTCDLCLQSRQIGWIRCSIALVPCSAPRRGLQIIPRMATPGPKCNLLARNQSQLETQFCLDHSRSSVPRPIRLADRHLSPDHRAPEEHYSYSRALRQAPQLPGIQPLMVVEVEPDKILPQQQPQRRKPRSQ